MKVVGGGQNPSKTLLRLFNQKIKFLNLGPKNRKGPYSHSYCILVLPKDKPVLTISFCETSSSSELGLYFSTHGKLVLEVSIGPRTISS